MAEHVEAAAAMAINRLAIVVLVAFSAALASPVANALTLLGSLVAAPVILAGWTLRHGGLLGFARGVGKHAHGLAGVAAVVASLKPAHSRTDNLLAVECRFDAPAISFGVTLLCLKRAGGVAARLSFTKAPCPYMLAQIFTGASNGRHLLLVFAVRVVQMLHKARLVACGQPADARSGYLQIVLG
jgi:hypothetical protein